MCVRVCVCVCVRVRTYACVYVEYVCVYVCMYVCKSKGVPRQAEVALGVPGRLRSRTFSTFGTTRLVGRQPKAPAAFTPGEIPGTHFQRLSRPQGTWFCRKEPRKKTQVTPPGIDPGTVRCMYVRRCVCMYYICMYVCIMRVCVCVCVCVCTYVRM